MDLETVFVIVFFSLVLPAAWVFLTPWARLEERLDFAEGMLTQQRETARLPAGHP